MCGTFGCGHDSSAWAVNAALSTSSPAPRDKESGGSGHGREEAAAPSFPPLPETSSTSQTDGLCEFASLIRHVGKGAFVPRATNRMRSPAFKRLELSMPAVQPTTCRATLFRHPAHMRGSSSQACTRHPEFGPWPLGFRRALLALFTAYVTSNLCQDALQNRHKLPQAL
jgi:hypothetical protein